VSFKDGRWQEQILYPHLKIAEFSPVADRDEVYRIYEEARAALGLAQKPRCELRCPYTLPLREGRKTGAKREFFGVGLATEFGE